MASVIWWARCAGFASVAWLAACGNSGVPATAGLPGIGQPPPVTPAKDAVVIQVLSNRADLISGGDALVEIVLPAGKDASALKVERNGSDVTRAFARRADGRVKGVVTGLLEGRNTLTAKLPEGGAEITITNHPLSGPIFSGPQIQPWYCLPGALDAQCSRPESIRYVYKSTAPTAVPCAQPGIPDGCGDFKSYDPANPPLDVAMTTTDEQELVPYIVRLETGSMDRNQYLIAVLADPATPFDRWSGPAAWNHKVYMTHGGGCGPGHNEAAAPDVLYDIALSRGYAVLSTTLENNQENCNMVVQAESVMMAKEHLIEAYGDVRYLMGMGGSGGSMAQLYMANAYPGLYDGVIAGATFPDIPYNDLLDCPALLRYWETPQAWTPGVVWTEPQQAAAAGLASTSICQAWTKVGATGYSNAFDPKIGTGCDIPDFEPEKVYRPDTNPTGVRCSLQDYMVNVFGSRPPDRWGPVEKQIGSGFAGRPYDNVGVQYGLRALLAGRISAAQFADLNAKIGAVDIDYGRQAERVVADPNALAIAYRNGIVNVGNHLDRVPIIDVPGAVPADNYEIHDIYKSWAMRQRMDAANGQHGNHVIWYGPNRTGQIDRDFSGPGALMVMDSWLDAISKDVRNVPLEQKVAENQPEGAGDRCEFPDRATCDMVFGPAGNIRYGAGMADFRNDIVKCQLKALDRADYSTVVFSDAQWAQLESAFPDGVCDYGKPAVGHQPTIPWISYAAGPGGLPMPAAPVSRSLP
ncbi:MAG: DUF6351 family protein [Pseudomonadota bacterium]